MLNDLPYAVFDTGTLDTEDGFKGAVNRWLLPRVGFFQFSVAQAPVGLRKKFMNTFVFLTWACAVGFNNYYNNYISQRYTQISDRFLYIHERLYMFYRINITREATFAR